MAKKTRTKNDAARKTAPAKKKASLKTLPSKRKAVAVKKNSPGITGSGKFVISTRDIIKVLQLNVRTAQRLLQKTRVALRKEKNDYVTVKEFCKVNKFNEGEFQERLMGV
jgi:hypothetical protein